MKIRLAKEEDLNEILNIYSYARSFMASTGNPLQWGGQHHPNFAFVKAHIIDGTLYVVYDDASILGVFVFAYGPDQTYNQIEGEWLNDEEYAVVHALAHREGTKGIFKTVIHFAKAKCKNIRIDKFEPHTHLFRLFPKLGSFVGR